MFAYALDEKTFTLTGTYTLPDGREIVSETQWNSEEEMDRNLTAAVDNMEVVVTAQAVKIDDVETGLQVGAKQKAKRVTFLGKEYYVMSLSGHNWDESSIILGKFKFEAPIVGGRIQFSKFTKRANTTSFFFGVGGKQSAFAIASATKKVTVNV